MADADPAPLRRQRRARLLDAMAADGVDVLLLGREANARYAGGVPRLWTSGTRPFAPGCVVVRATEAVHLLSTWDDGVPDDIPHDHLFAFTWNPMNLVGSVARIPGVGEARRVGVDGMSPLFAQLLPHAAPHAELVGVAAERMAALGVPTPAVEPVVSTVPTRRVTTDTGLAAGDSVALTVGALRNGYEGVVTRTVACEQATPAHRRAAERAGELLGALVERCRPGASTDDIGAAYTAAGVERPAFP